LENALKKVHSKKRVLLIIKHAITPHNDQWGMIKAGISRD
jgi:hypothetical protein